MDPGINDYYIDLALFTISCILVGIQTILLVFAFYFCKEFMSYRRNKRSQKIHRHQIRNLLKLVNRQRPYELDPVRLRRNVERNSIKRKTCTDHTYSELYDLPAFPVITIRQPSTKSNRSCKPNGGKEEPQEKQKYGADKSRRNETSPDAKQALSSTNAYAAQPITIPDSTPLFREMPSETHYDAPETSISLASISECTLTSLEDLSKTVSMETKTDSMQSSSSNNSCEQQDEQMCKIGNSGKIESKTRRQIGVSDYYTNDCKCCQ